MLLLPVLLLAVGSAIIASAIAGCGQCYCLLLAVGSAIVASATAGCGQCYCGGFFWGGSYTLLSLSGNSGHLTSVRLRQPQE